jgi:hypothetical protein
MSLRVHPLCDDTASEFVFGGIANRSIRGRDTRVVPRLSDVFATREISSVTRRCAAGVSELVVAVREVFALGRGMREVVPRRHVVAVIARDFAEVGAERERFQTAFRPLLVDVFVNESFDFVPIDTARCRCCRSCGGRW